MLYIQYVLLRWEVVPLKILISSQSELPIYAQIKEQIKEQILNGTLVEGDVLPSIRQLAKEAGVGVITITRAYNDLEGEGFIASMQGKGSIVLSRDNNMIKEQYLKRIEEGLEIAIENADYMKMPDDELISVLKNLLQQRS